MLKVLSWDFSIDHMHLKSQIKISRWMTMKRIAVERFMAGRSAEMKGKNVLLEVKSKKFQYSINQVAHINSKFQLDVGSFTLNFIRKLEIPN